MKRKNEPTKPHVNNLHKRFIKWVLLPPFIALILLSLLGLWSLNRLLKQQSITDLQRSSDTTATVLDRELSLRKDVLERTATEMLVIQRQFEDLQNQLQKDKIACLQHILATQTFANSPNGACDPFASDLANNGVSSTTLDSSFDRLSKEQVNDQSQRTNERLGAFKQIFPETLALVIVDEENNVQSSALSGALKGSTKPFLPFTSLAMDEPVHGAQLSLEDFKLGVFAYPINGGAALAAYDIYNENFLRRVWDSAPIDRTQALAVIIDGQNNVVYPNTTSSNQIKQNGSQLRSANVSELDLDGVKHTLVTSSDNSSGWGIVVASPTAAVLAQSRDAQLLSVIIICLFIIGFIWMGSLFIQRTLANIVRLMSGALIFSSGRLDYEIDLDDADDEFMRLGETMNKMAQRIADAENALDQKNKQFINVATREIRELLASIIGYLDLLQEIHGEKLNKQAKKLLDQSLDSSTRLKDLVNDMLDVARLESGRTEMHIEPLETQQLVQDTVNAMLITAKDKGISLEYEPALAIPVLADDAKLRIVLTNFISNAIKYNRPKAGWVKVYHKDDNDKIITAVSDNGLGIPKDQQAHMFEKFFRVDNEDRASVIGTGLGMYITKQYIQEMGGELWFESEHQKGTTFFFSLPKAPVKKVSRTSKLKTKAKKTAKALKRRKNRK